MKIKHQFETCILCLSQPPGDWEHIIPRYLGGRLQARLLCNKCNHTVGATLISTLKTNPSIRLAFEALKDQIPSLYRKAQDKATYIGVGEDGSRVRVARRGTALKVIPGRGEGDSVIRDTTDASNDLRKILLKSGVAEEEAAVWLKRFAALPENTLLHLPTNHVFVKKPIPPLKPELLPHLLDDRIPSLIAFEFLALIIGSQIYKTSFDPVRQYIQQKGEANYLHIEHLSGGECYDTIHAILIEPQQTSFSVVVRLFRWLTYRVTFHGFEYHALDSLYFENLTTLEAYIAVSHEDAKAGRWIRL